MQLKIQINSKKIYHFNNVRLGLEIFVVYTIKAIYIAH
jgi:hypothetical protein